MASGPPLSLYCAGRGNSLDLDLNLKSGVRWMLLQRQICPLTWTVHPSKHHTHGFIRSRTPYSPKLQTPRQRDLHPVLPQRRSKLPPAPVRRQAQFIILAAPGVADELRCAVRERVGDGGELLGQCPGGVDGEGLGCRLVEDRDCARNESVKGTVHAHCFLGGTGRVRLVSGGSDGLLVSVDLFGVGFLTCETIREIHLGEIVTSGIVLEEYGMTSRGGVTVGLRCTPVASSQEIELFNASSPHDRARQSNITASIIV